MKDLLVCIAHHVAPGRGQYLATILKAFATEYKLSLDIIIDVQIADVHIDVADIWGPITTIVSHVSLEHPFWLTWMHRRHMRDRIDDYRWFAYFEDDIYLPFENFIHYQTRWDLLWTHFVPGFIRVEKHDGEEWVVDVTQRQQERRPHWAATAPHRDHLSLNQPYHGFWIMPQDALKASMGPNFVRLSDSREAAASYPIADLNKTALVEIDDDGKVDRRCFAYHISNSYSGCPTSPFGKIRVEDIFL